MEYREREIDLINLLWKIAFAWRWCLAIALICMILLPGAMYIKNLNAYNKSVSANEQNQTTNDNLSKEEQTERVLKNLTEDEKNAVNQAVAAAKEYDLASKYLESAPIMKIDAYNEDAYIIEYLIDPGFKSGSSMASSDSYSGTLVTAYTNLVNNGTVANNVIASGTVPYSALQLQSMIVIDNSNSNIITISVIVPDDTMRTQISNVIKDTFEGSKDKITQDIGNHDLIIMNEYQVNRIDTDLLTAQKSTKERVTAAKTALDNAKKALKENQLSAMNSILKIEGISSVQSSGNSTATNTASTQSTSGQSTSKPQFSVKYAAIGFIIGILLVALIVALIEIFSKKLRYDYELKDVFGVNPLYTIRKNKEYKGLDAWIYKMSTRGRNKNEESLEHFILNISLLLKGKDVKRLLITGTKSDALVDSSKQAIIDGLNKEGISVEFSGNVCNDQNSLMLADEIKTILVVEQIGSSHFDDIVKEFETFREHEIEVAGGVVVE